MSVGYVGKIHLFVLYLCFVLVEVFVFCDMKDDDNEPKTWFPLVILVVGGGAGF